MSRCTIMDGILIGFGIVAATIIITAIYRFASARPINTQKCRKCHFSTNDPEVVIIGAGITGASLAAALGSNGRRVVVIERDMSPPNTFRGEALTPGGITTLQDMGLKEVVDDFKGMPYDGLTVFDYDTGIKTKIIYSKSGVTTFHGNLVQPLRMHAKSERTVEFIEGVATDLVNEKGRITGVKYKEKGSQDIKVIRAPLTVVCDGYYSKLRKISPNLKSSVTESYYVGVDLTNVQHPDPSYPEIGVGSPLVQTIIYRLDDVKTRILFLFRNKTPENVGQYLQTQVVPSLPDFLQTSVQEALRRQKYFKSIEVKRMPASFDSLAGVLVIGDALNTRDAVLGTGMSVAFNDVKFWHRALSDIPDLSDDDAVLKERENFQKERKSYAWTVNMLAHAVIRLGSERQSSSIHLRRALMRNMKALETDAPPEVRTAAYGLFSLMNVDEALARMILYNTCRDAVLQCVTWRGLLTNPWKTVKDVYGIITKYWSIISTDV